MWMSEDVESSIERNDTIGSILSEDCANDLIADLVAGDKQEKVDGSIEVNHGGLDKMGEIPDLEFGKIGMKPRRIKSKRHCGSSRIPKSTIQRRDRMLVKFFVPPKEKVDENILDRRSQFNYKQNNGFLKTSQSMPSRIMVSIPDVAPQSELQNRFPRSRKREISRPSRICEAEPGNSLQLNDGCQYRLTAISSKRMSGKSSCCFDLLTCFGCGTTYNIYDDPTDGQGTVRSRCSANALVIKYLHWNFRSSISLVALSASVLYFSATFFFALLIWSITYHHPTCFGKPDMENDSAIFVDAWHLSWTTFATVGYGAAFAGTSSTEASIQLCAGMVVLTSLEAYCGMIFGSVMCAILFARVGRVRRYAPVIFSDPMIIRYGQGVQSQLEGSEYSDIDEDSVESTKLVGKDLIPCPVLEFRIANSMHGVSDGEIVDCTMNVVASMNADIACPTICKAASFRRQASQSQKRRLYDTPQKVYNRSSLTSKATENDEEQIKGMIMKIINEITTSLDIVNENNISHYSEEDPIGNCVHHRIFSKLNISPPDHPFFKRVWIVSHVLDKDSPLLTSEARQLVVSNGGYWPHELNSYTGVRNAVVFDQIVVSMRGISHVDANFVYAQKVYDFNNLWVGYRFMGMLYRNEKDQNLLVDLRLINDVTEQAGGGGEPLQSMENDHTVVHSQ